MPVSVKHLKGGGYRVSTPHGVKARHATKTNAERQKRLLNAVDHGWKPSGKSVKESQISAQAKLLVNKVLVSARAKD